VQVKIENSEMTNVKEGIRALTSSILMCKNESEAWTYRPQLQREERKLSQMLEEQQKQEAL